MCHNCILILILLGLRWQLAFHSAVVLSASSGNFFSSYVRAKVWNDEQKTSGVCSYFRERRSVWGCEMLSGPQQQLYVSRTGLSGQDLALMESSWGDGTVEALRNIQIFGICINPTVVIAVKAEFRAVKSIRMHVSGRSGLLQTFVGSAGPCVLLCTLDLYMFVGIIPMKSQQSRGANASGEDGCTDSLVSSQSRSCAWKIWNHF